ncbi:hypothetical protein RKE30_16005 [Streptomyces sp. Li-HN-5-11]|nr:hypothetical protein [Streptomyces sp. Li-HN-5-11]WNM31802.1 hypothetical protein RKE30_16005 [Streptomyces sp. Li-HN-5-11]
MGALRRAAGGHDVSVKSRSRQIGAPAEKLAIYRKKAEAALAAAQPK